MCGVARAKDRAHLHAVGKNGRCWGSLGKFECGEEGGGETAGEGEQIVGGQYREG